MRSEYKGKGVGTKIRKLFRRSYNSGAGTLERLNDAINRWDRTKTNPRISHHWFLRPRHTLLQIRVRNAR